MLGAVTVDANVIRAGVVLIALKREVLTSAIRRNCPALLGQASSSKTTSNALVAVPRVGKRIA